MMKNFTHSCSYVNDMFKYLKSITEVLRRRFIILDETFQCPTFQKRQLQFTDTHRENPFSRYAKFSEKLTFVTP